MYVCEREEGEGKESKERERERESRCVCVKSATTDILIHMRAWMDGDWCMYVCTAGYRRSVITCLRFILIQIPGKLLIGFNLKSSKLQNHGS